MGKAELAETLDGLRRPLADVFVLVGRITGNEQLRYELNAAHEALGRLADGFRAAPLSARPISRPRGSTTFAGG